MKSLLYKDLVISRKYYIMAFIYCMLIAVCMFLIRLSMSCGNLSHNEEILYSLKNNLWLLQYTPCVCLMISFAIDGGTIYSDVNSGWNRFCSTTSVGEERIVLSKMLSRFVSVTGAYIFSYIYLVIFSLVGGDYITLDIAAAITAIYAVSLILSFLNIMTVFTVKKKQSAQLIGVAAIGVVGTCLSGFLMIKMDTLKAADDIDLFDFFRTEFEPLKPYLLPVSIAVLAAVVFISYIVSVKMLKRREN